MNVYRDCRYILMVVSLFSLPFFFGPSGFFGKGPGTKGYTNIGIRFKFLYLISVGNNVVTQYRIALIKYMLAHIALNIVN